MVNECEASKLPKFFAKIPFWIWPVLGLICLALSIPGFMAIGERKERAAALAGSVPPLVDLAEFDRTTDIAAAGEVNIFAQTSPEYRFLVDGSGLGAGSSYVIPLFSAVASPKEKSVQHVLIVRDFENFEAWLTEKSIGTARMGDLYEINGEVIDGRGFTAAIRMTLRDAGLEQVDPLMIVEPFVAGLSKLGFATYGNPFILAASGVWMIWFGFVVWSRVKAHKLSLRRRMGEIGDRTTSEGDLNLSRLKRSSEKLASARGAASADMDPLQNQAITPAE